MFCLQSPTNTRQSSMFCGLSCELMHIFWCGREVRVTRTTPAKNGFAWQERTPPLHLGVWFSAFSLQVVVSVQFRRGAFGMHSGMTLPSNAYLVYMLSMLLCVLLPLLLSNQTVKPPERCHSLYETASNPLPPDRISKAQPMSLAVSYTHLTLPTKRIV